MSIEDFYDQSAAVITVTKPGDFSTALPSETTVSFSCAINPVSGYEKFAGGHNEVMADYKLFCSSTVALTEQTRVKWNSKYYNVVFVKDTFKMGHHLLAFLKKDVR